MPRNKVLEKAKANISASRSAFDCSHERSQTAIAGDIQVVYAQPFVKGTNGKINVDSFTRSAAVVAPAFHRVTEHIDFFKVPIHSLWRYWENWKLNINDMQDTNLVPWNSSTDEVDLSIPSYAPRMNYHALTRSLYGSQSPSVLLDVQNLCRKMNDVLRLCDELRISDKLVFHDASTPTTYSTVLSLFMPAAYQKIYFEHYRNTAYESNNPYAFNLDWLTSSGANGLLTPDDSDSTKSKHTVIAREIFKRRRVNYRNDYFHNIYPSLNYVLSSPNGINWLIPSDIGQLGLNANGYSSTVVGNQYGVTLRSSGNINSNGVNYPGTVQAIRTAFALDKIMRASAYAPKHVRDQYKAQFGVDGEKYDKDMCSERLGSFQSEIVFQEVTNMAESSSAALGDLGAKGIGSTRGNKDISFYCDDDCIIMGVRYFMPRARYDANGIHPWNVKIAREDFYQKAFENLGLRPFYWYNVDQGANMNAQIGWTVPNFEYKILPDLNFDCFKETYCDFWATQTGQVVTITKSGNTQDFLRAFVPHTNEVLLGNGPVTADYFKVSAEDLNNLFAVQVTPNHHRSVYQFYSNIRVKCAVVAPMSVHGQPSL